MVSDATVIELGPRRSCAVRLSSVCQMLNISQGIGVVGQRDLGDARRFSSCMYCESASDLWYLFNSGNPFVSGDQVETGCRIRAR